MKPFQINPRAARYLSAYLENKEHDIFTDKEDADPILLAIQPCGKLEIMKTSECFTKQKFFRDYRPVHTIHDWDSPANRLIALSHPDLVLDIGPRRYVVGQVVVCATDRSGNPVSLEFDQIQAALDYFRRKSVRLHIDDDPMPAFSL